MTDNPTQSAYFTAVQAMYSGLPVGDGLNALAVALESVVPTEFSAALRTLAVSTDQSVFNAWLTQQLASYTARADVLWFSLSDSGDEISLCLLRQKRVPNGDHDWAACEHILAFDVPSEILQPLCDFIDAEWSSEDTRWIAQTCIPLAWSGLIVARAMKDLPTRIVLGQDAIRRVAVFFAEGDDIFLGEVSQGGFRFFSAPEMSG